MHDEHDSADRPPDDRSPPDRSSADRRRDTARRRFAEQLQSDAAPSVAEHLRDVPDSEQALVLEALMDVLREQLAEGSVAARPADLLAANPDFAAPLSELLDAGSNSAAPTATHGAPGARNPAGGGLHVRCPHCHVPIELAFDAEFDSVACSTCGSDFSLVADDGATATATPMGSVAHFDLIERVGRGAFGAVWKAHDTRLNRTVAIKIPRRGQFDAAQERAFLREAQNAAHLNHPGIVPVYEVGRDGDTLYIVSEFVHGVSLRSWLEVQKPTIGEAAQMMASIAEAVHHAHERGVVHRDLKPDNVMLDTDGSPRVMDFGLAKRETAEYTLALDGQLLGTPQYMSPEQARLEPHKADARSDVYSMGVMLFQLLTGELPFRGNREMYLHQVLNDEPPSPRKLNALVPRDLETITLKCLEKEPKRRYQTAGELGEELRRHLHREPIVARRTPRLKRAWLWARRNPSTAVLLPLIVAVVAAGGIAALIFAHAESQRREAEASLVAEAEASLVAQVEASHRAEAEAREARRLQLHFAEKLRRAESELEVARAESANKSESPSFTVNVSDASGKPISGVTCRVVVGGYPTDERGYPQDPAPENQLRETTSAAGSVTFTHAGFANGAMHMLYVDSDELCDASRRLDQSDITKGSIDITLSSHKYVELRYAYQPEPSRSFEGDSVVEGRVVLHPKQGGSYRPPARAYFSFAKNTRIGGGGLLSRGEPNLEIDQVGDNLYFDGSGFGHVTRVRGKRYDELDVVDVSALDRERTDTLIDDRGVYIYESNIFPKARRTKFTGYEVRYAKVEVIALEPANFRSSVAVSRIDTDTDADATSRVTFRPGAKGLHGATSIDVHWLPLDAQQRSLLPITTEVDQPEFPARASGTERRDFRRGREPCMTASMKQIDERTWRAQIDTPPQTTVVAIVFTDELGRTSEGGIVEYALPATQGEAVAPSVEDAEEETSLTAP